MQLYDPSEPRQVPALDLFPIVASGALQSFELFHPPLIHQSCGQALFLCPLFHFPYEALVSVLFLEKMMNLGFLHQFYFVDVQRLILRQRIVFSVICRR